jgi:hypothetical protein
MSCRPPQPPVEGPLSTDQINLTDEESRIMPVAGGGFEQCYNAQAVVAADSLLVVAADVVQAANDKQQFEPMVEHLNALPEGLGKIATLLADNGYFSAANITACRWLLRTVAAASLLVPLASYGARDHAVATPTTSGQNQYSARFHTPHRWISPQRRTVRRFSGTNSARAINSHNMIPVSVWYRCTASMVM